MSDATDRVIGAYADVTRKATAGGANPRLRKSQVERTWGQDAVLTLLENPTIRVVSLWGVEWLEPRWLGRSCRMTSAMEMSGLRTSGPGRPLSLEQRKELESSGFREREDEPGEWELRDEERKFRACVEPWSFGYTLQVWINGQRVVQTGPVGSNAVTEAAVSWARMYEQEVLRARERNEKWQLSK